MNEDIETPRLESVADVEREMDAKPEPDLESVMHLIWDRLEALQEERRRVRHYAAVFATVALTAVVLWAGFPSRNRASDPALFRDANGNVRARFDLDPESGRTTLQLVDAKGTPQAVLGADVAGPMLTFYDKDGATRMRVGLEEGSEAPIVDVIDRASGEKSRVNLVNLQQPSSVQQPTLVPSPAPPKAVVRRAAARGVRGSRRQPPVTEASAASATPHQVYAVCLPGKLGCWHFPFGGEG